MVIAKTGAIKAPTFSHNKRLALRLAIPIPFENSDINKGNNKPNIVDAKFATSDDDINIATIGGDYVEVKDAICIIRTWLGTEFKGGRYQERIEMINQIEKENMK